MLGNDREPMKLLAQFPMCLYHGVQLAYELCRTFTEVYEQFMEGTPL